MYKVIQSLINGAVPHTARLNHATRTVQQETFGAAHLNEYFLGIYQGAASGYLTHILFQ